ncbi:OmpA family protein [Enterobacteriaceae endosymbiont of Donacia thalassina]|uniref:OmpA family protein n=1 Tax=Enterobacteriaceae endosymbiont of Donacia thalassina TaxID=2675786 RepID=UPI0014490A45|nr:OmpA family protein [Enterobacteriaceae endosymbiont of Donacia thalassina]QJC37297.1 OmpA family protein [Enterobacteriaceae endosymbiont of Donacia thalassina]
MKKITIIFIMIIMNIYNIAYAESDFKDYWYFGSKFGLSQYNHIKLLGKDIDDKEYTLFNKIGNGLFFGYQSNNFLGFEIGFDWLGAVKKNIQDKNENTINFFESKGIQLTSNVRYPIFKNVYLYSRLGGLFTKSINKQYDKNNYNKNLDNIYYNLSPLMVLGGEYLINNNFSSRLEYQFAGKIGNKDYDDLGQQTNNSMITLSLIYKFTDKYHLPSIRNLINKAKNNYYNNYSNNNILSKTKVYFNSNKIILGKQNKKKLNKVIENNIKNNNLSKNNDNKIIILGHSDYLEKDNNNFLSQKRAQKIAEYLSFKNKDLIKKIIIVKGLGSNLSINKNCLKIKNYKILKKCLVIDRYVEIKILKIPKKIIKKHVFNKKLFFMNNHHKGYKYNYGDNDYLNNEIHNFKNKLFIYKQCFNIISKLDQMYKIQKNLYLINKFLYKS